MLNKKPSLKDKIKSKLALLRKPSLKDKLKEKLEVKKTNESRESGSDTKGRKTKKESKK